MLVVLRKISGDPLKMGNIFPLEKYLSASFNTHPPGVLRPGSTWDVNVLLDYFVKLGPNEKITKSNILGGKLVLQLLLTQLCRSSEVAQLQMSMMRILHGTIQFRLNKPVKTCTARNYNVKSKAQLMTVKEFDGHPLLCPVKTLLAYIQRTKFKRLSVDHLFVLVTTQEPRRATAQTIVRWAKDIMRDAGLAEFNVHSTRGVGATAGLLMGLPLDEIVRRVGWTRATTFMKYYMKPVKQLDDKEPAFDPDQKSCPSKLPTVNLADPHGFARQVQKLTPKTRLCKDIITQKPIIRPGVSSVPAPVYAPVVKPSSCTVSKPPSDDEDEGKLYIDEDEVPTSPYTGSREPDPYDFDIELKNVREDALNKEIVQSLQQSPHIEPSPAQEHDVSIISLSQSEISNLPVLEDDIVDTTAHFSASTPVYKASLPKKPSKSPTKIPLKKGTILIEKSFVLSQVASSSSANKNVNKQPSSKQISTVSQGKSRNLRAPLATTVHVNPELTSKLWVEPPLQGGQPWII